MTARLRETYKNEVFPALKEKFNYENVMEVPKLEKVTRYLKYLYVSFQYLPDLWNSHRLIF